MALSNITIPSFTTLIPVDTRTNNLKVLLLPTVSTNSGQFIMFKDYYGTASNSTFTISTTGTDLLDDINNRYTFSNAFGSMGFVSDGVRSWRTIGLYNGALTPSGSILQPNLPATPSVYLIASLYSGSGTWFDSSPNGRNATLENGVIAKNAAGNGIVLNGSTNWIFPNVAVGNVWTLSAWYKNTGAIVGANPCVVTQIYPTNPNVINLVLGYGGVNVGFSFWRGGWLAGTAISLSNTDWRYFTGTWNGTTLTTYINGLLQGSTTPTGPSSNAGTQYRIGRRWDSAEYVRGEIGEVRIYPIALTAAQVLTDYNYGAPFYTN
jgi:hypothetical protein